MSVGNSVKRVAAELNMGLKMYKFMGGFKSSSIGAILDTSRSKNIQHFDQQLTPLSLCKNHTEKLCFISPKLDVGIRKNIIEPEKSIKINFELPIRNSTVSEMDLPLHIEKEISEPGKVISKKAIYMIRVRRKKMRKHKRKKFLKKYAAELYQRRLKRETEKENTFKASIRTILDAGDKFSAEKYVNDTLAKVNWERPVTHVRGRLAPQWVIKQHLQEQEEKRTLEKRLKECLE